MMKKQKVAFIVQRSGKEVNGGAESYCFTIAEKMKKYWDIEILTTCALDYMTWENYYDEGIEVVNDIPIRRFKVDEVRDIEKFNNFYKNGMPEAETTTIEKAETWMKLQGPNSENLTAFIKNNSDKYDAFIFFTYIYATTYFNLPFVKEKAYLASFAHDERPIYLPIWKDFFKKPKKMIFSTVEEKNFLQKQFPDVKFDGDIFGIGIDKPNDISNIRFRQKYDIYSPYILYIGRIDESKGVHDLIQYFLKFIDKYKINIKLVLAGKSVIDIPKNEFIKYIGFIDEQTKFDAIEDCELLVNSSPFESLSMVLLEAWSMNRPVLVNRISDVMVGQCKRSGGGKSYLGYDSFENELKSMLDENKYYDTLSSFIESEYSWKVIENKFLKLLD
ncbi:glycosyltransferase family 4 protein [Halarcobacter sp.]|uniref:glycosyltransferase family 4 protein n=1 Tax=Halarcobacter sp. TaxID=2321133 RepID=UPI002AA684B6|nr:glycosyltransferase family 4 protein [Halarcobacter sp.]